MILIIALFEYSGAWRYALQGTLTYLCYSGIRYFYIRAKQKRAEATAGDQENSVDVPTAVASVDSHREKMPRFVWLVPLLLLAFLVCYVMVAALVMEH